MALEQNENIIHLANQKLTKIEYLPGEWPLVAIYDQNEIVKIENLEKYYDLQQLSIAENKIIYMHGLSKLSNITVLNLPNNQILAIDGVKNLLKLTWLNLSGNKIKTIEHLDNNIHLKHLDLSDNRINNLGNISHLHRLKTLLLHGNHIQTLRHVSNYFPQSIEILSLAENEIHDLNEVRFLTSLNILEQLSIMNNPCIKFPSQDIIFDYRPYVVNWCLKLRILDGYSISEKESLKAEWLYSQGRGRSFQLGQHLELVFYLSQNCPITTLKPDADEDEKMAKILHKQRYHQKQLKRESPISQNKERPYSDSPNYSVEVPASLYEGHIPVKPIKAWSDHHSPQAPEDSVRSRLNVRQIIQTNQSNMVRSNQPPVILTPVPPSSQEPRHHGHNNGGNHPILQFRARHLYSPINDSQIVAATGDAEARKSTLSMTNTSLLESESVYLPVYSQGSPSSGGGTENSSPEAPIKQRDNRNLIMAHHPHVTKSSVARGNALKSSNQMMFHPPQTNAMLKVCDIISSENDADSSEVEDFYYNPPTSVRPHHQNRESHTDTAGYESNRKRHVASRSSRDASAIGKSSATQPDKLSHPISAPIAFDSRIVRGEGDTDSDQIDSPSSRSHNSIPHQSRLAINFPIDNKQVGGIRSVPQLHKMAVLIQATWRGYYCRTRNPRVRQHRQKSLQTRTIQHIAFLQTQMDLYYKNYEKERNMRELQNQAVAYLMDELREIKEWKKNVESGLSSILTTRNNMTLASTTKDAPPLTLDPEIPPPPASVTEIPNSDDPKVSKLEATCRHLESEVSRLSTCLAVMKNQVSHKFSEPINGEAEEEDCNLHRPSELRIVERSAIMSEFDSGWVQILWSASRLKDSNSKEKIKAYIVLLNGEKVAELAANRLTVRIDLSNTRVNHIVHVTSLGTMGSQSALSEPLLIKAISRPISTKTTDDKDEAYRTDAAHEEPDEDDSIREISEIPTEDDSDRERFIEEAMKVMDMPDTDDSDSPLGSTTKERQDCKKTTDTDCDSNIESDCEDQKINTAIRKDDNDQN